MIQDHKYEKFGKPKERKTSNFVQNDVLQWWSVKPACFCGLIITCKKKVRTPDCYVIQKSQKSQCKITVFTALPDLGRFLLPKDSRPDSILTHATSDSMIAQNRGKPIKGSL